jgi:hypothetical protein
MKDSTMRFERVPGVPVTCLTFTRRDGHCLSLTSMDNGIVHFDEESNMVTDHGGHHGTATFLEVLNSFLKDDPEEASQ